MNPRADLHVQLLCDLKGIFFFLSCKRARKDRSEGKREREKNVLRNTASVVVPDLLGTFDTSYSNET